MTLSSLRRKRLAEEELGIEGDIEAYLNMFSNDLLEKLYKALESHFFYHQGYDVSSLKLCLITNENGSIKLHFTSAMEINTISLTADSLTLEDKLTLLEKIEQVL